MIELLLYTATGIILYLGTDRALRYLEEQHGEPLPYRNIIFFVIIFTLAMISFALIRQLLDPALPLPPATP